MCNYISHGVETCKCQDAYIGVHCEWTWSSYLSTLTLYQCGPHPVIPAVTKCTYVNSPVLA